MSKLVDGLIVTAVAMGIVFLVLIVLQFVIKFESKIIEKIYSNKKSKTKDFTEVAVSNTVQQNVIESKDESQMEEINLKDEQEEVAAVMAALSAYTGTSVQGLKIRTIKRIGRQNNWKNA